ncbi:MAG: zinc-ribbon domain-containing protein [Spirochaetota bacterium]
MIVRCKNCNSAFAVDDDKVSGKKFAFSCLKCGTENIIDNRISQTTEDSTLSSPIDMEPDFSDDTFAKEPVLDHDIISPDEESIIDDSDSITDAEPDTIPDDIDLFTDDEILSFQDEDEIETEDEIDKSEIISEDINQDDLLEKDDAEPKLSSQEDIDQLFAIATDPEEEIKTEDDEPLDLDAINLEFEDTVPDEPATPEKDFTSEDDIDIDLTDIDFDMEDSKNITDDTDSANGIALDFDENDLTLDLDNLDIDLAEETLIDEDSKDESNEILEDSEEELTLNLDELDIDLDETASSDLEDVAFDADEDLTLNLDDLDIELEDIGYADEESKIISNGLPDSDDEDLTLNLNELDIELEDEAIKASLEKIDGHIPDDPDTDEDESITIDLDTLDIDVEDYAISDDISNLEAEEKLTIDDAGVTFDELVKDDIGLSIDEADPDLELQNILSDSSEEETPVIDTLSELPEIDLDEYDDYLIKEDTPEQKEAPVADDNEINFDDIEIIPIDDDFDLYTPENDFSDASIPARGTTALSIDFSLKYSKLEALFRLTGLYLISLIPHFIVLLLYMAVSTILGLVNQIIILFTGHCLEDFAQIIENTLRYLITIKTNIIGIVEDRPEFSGKENLNHQLQINITYPLKYSKNIAILRLSIVGILLFTLPHIAILTILTISVPFVFIAGLIIVIATGRWPGIFFNYLTIYFRYLTKLAAFIIGLNDEYPLFRLK